MSNNIDLFEEEIDLQTILELNLIFLLTNHMISLKVIKINMILYL